MKIFGRVIEVGDYICRIETSCAPEGGDVSSEWIVSKSILESIRSAEVGMLVSFDSENIRATIKNLAIKP